VGEPVLIFVAANKKKISICLIFLKPKAETGEKVDPEDSWFFISSGDPTMEWMALFYFSGILRETF